MLNGIEQPNIWHENTLTGNETYGGLFQDAPPLFDVVMMNPPFGGREGLSETEESDGQRRLLRIAKDCLVNVAQKLHCSAE